MDLDLSKEEDRLFYESCLNLAAVSEEAQRIKNEKKEKERLEALESGAGETSEKKYEIPPEQQLAPAVRVPQFKKLLPEEEVNKTLKNMEFMPREMLAEALKKLSFPNLGGSRRQLKKRVADAYRLEKWKYSFSRNERFENPTLAHFDYLICLDFEATCCEFPFQYAHEIIEFPAVLIDVKSQRVVSKFHTFVRPEVNPKLDPFCTSFTGITQAKVDNALPFRETLQNFYKWMRRFNLGGVGKRFAFVTDGPHDLWKFFQYQCLLSGIKVPHAFRHFINIKAIFKNMTPKFEKMQNNGKTGIENMLDCLGEKFKGSTHSGLDDASNIARIAIKLMRLKVELTINQKMSPGPPPRYQPRTDIEKMTPEEIKLEDVRHWLRILPLRVRYIRTFHFHSGAYEDCDSCDEEREEQEKDEELSKQNLAWRAILEQEQDEEFEEQCKEHNHWFVRGELQPVPNVLVGELVRPDSPVAPPPAPKAPVTPVVSFKSTSAIPRKPVPRKPIGNFEGAFSAIFADFTKVRALSTSSKKEEPEKPKTTIQEELEIIAKLEAQRDGYKNKNKPSTSSAQPDVFAQLRVQLSRTNGNKDDPEVQRLMKEISKKY